MMILVPDPHKTRHKKMTGELIPSPSCNGVSSPYQGLLLRPKCTIQMNLCVIFGRKAFRM